MQQFPITATPEHDRAPYGERDPGGAVQRAARITAIMGVVHGVLLLSAYALVSTYGPGPDAGSAKYTEFYSSERHQQWVLVAGIYLIPFAGIAFLWFSGTASLAARATVAAR